MMMTAMNDDNLSSLMLDVEATTRGLMLMVMYDDDDNE